MLIKIIILQHTHYITEPYHKLLNDQTASRRYFDIQTHISLPPSENMDRYEAKIIEITNLKPHTVSSSL